MIFTLTFAPIFSDEDVDDVVKKFPSILATYANLKVPAVDYKIKWSRTDLLENHSINQLTLRDKQIFLGDFAIIFQTPEQAKIDYSDFYGRKDKLPRVIYKWEFEIVNEGDYFVVVGAEPGSNGFLNNESIVCLSNGVVSLKKSGALKIKLIKGSNSLFLSTHPRCSNQIFLASEKDANQIKDEITKRLFSNTKKDFVWATTVFMPYLSSLKNGVYLYFNNLLSKLNKSHPFEKTPEMVEALFSYISQNNLDGYQIEKHIYNTFPEHYFLFTKNETANTLPLNNFFKINYGNQVRLGLLKNLIYDGQKIIAEKYFNKCIEAFANSALSTTGKENFISYTYNERYISLFRIGRIREANDILKATIENCKKYKYDWYENAKVDQENMITLTHSFDENTAYQNIELIENYDGSPSQLAHLYKIYTGLSLNLVKTNDGAESLFFAFVKGIRSNEKLKKDFENFCSTKIKNQIAKAIEDCDLNQLEDLLEKNETFVQMSEIRITLMEEYFKTGAFLKALSQVKFIFNNYPQYQSKIISRLVILENICEIPIEQRTTIPENLKKAEIKLNGQTLTLETLYGQNPKSNGALGKFLKAIPLEPAHVQYWNQPQISYHQPIEPIFTRNDIILNGGSYLTAYNLKTNSTNWSYHSEAEYKKDNENGPHQKRFITRHSGNLLLSLTNRDFSEKKP